MNLQLFTNDPDKPSLSTIHATQCAELVNRRNKRTFPVAPQFFQTNWTITLHGQIDSAAIACAVLDVMQWHSGYCCCLAVREDYEGHGIGSKLMHKREELAKQLNLFCMQAIVRADNIASFRIRERLGWRRLMEFPSPVTTDRLVLCYKQLIAE